MPSTNSLKLYTVQSQGILNKNKQLPNLLKHSKIPMSPTEVSCHRKYKLTDSKIQKRQGTNCKHYAMNIPTPPQKMQQKFGKQTYWKWPLSQKKTLNLKSKSLTSQCLAEKGTDTHTKSWHNITIHFYSHKPFHYCPWKEGPFHPWNILQNVVDFRKNKWRIKILVLSINEIVQNIFRITWGKLISTLHITSDYYNKTVAEDCRKYTVFITKCGKYEFILVPSDICVAHS